MVNKYKAMEEESRAQYDSVPFCRHLLDGDAPATATQMAVDALEQAHAVCVDQVIEAAEIAQALEYLSKNERAKLHCEQFRMHL